MGEKPLYALTDEKKTLDDGTVLHRIRTNYDIPEFGVKAGDVGGWVESLENIVKGWVADEAMVYGHAVVDGRRALVSGHARVSDGASVEDGAVVTEWARVYGNASIYGMGKVSGQARVCDDASVADRAHVFGDAFIADQAGVRDDSKVYGAACVLDYANTYDNSKVHGNARICDVSKVSGNAEVAGWGRLYGRAHVSGEAKVTRALHILTSEIWTLSHLYVTLFPTKAGHQVNAGCWSGTVDELSELIAEDSWVESRGEIVEEARPEFEALIAQLRARIARWERMKEQK